MALRITPNLILSSETVRDIVKKKINYVDRDLVLTLRPFIMQIPKFYGRLGQYTLLRFGVSHPMIKNMTRFLDCFVKIPPPIGSSEYSIVRDLGLFNREVELYTIVFPQILKPEDTEIVPKCFYADRNRVLILNWMESLDYDMINKMKDLDFPHCIAVIKSLARFHARTIIYEERNGGCPLLNDCETLWNVQLQLRPYDSLMQKLLIGNAQSLSNVFELIPELIPLDHKDFRKQFRSFVAKFFHTITAEKFSDMRVLCHSDLMASNLLFRYNKDEEPIMCCMIDFQFTKYSSLSYDLWSFLFENTTKKMRSERMEEFKKIYYETFCKYLNKDGIDAACILSYSAFENLMKKDRVYGLIQAILSLYAELREEMKFTYGNEYRRIWNKMWMNSPDLLCKDYDEFQRYNHRIVEEILELYHLIMTNDVNDFEQN